jgi:hypothetical protein
MTKVAEVDFSSALQIIQGTVRNGAETVFGVVKDEMYYLPAFLEHYRLLGAKQFIFLDDRSTDGTREFLSAQDDCVVLSSPFSFGERITLVSFGGNETEGRAGIFAKSAIPRRFLRGQYAVYVDADEFLVLPPSHGQLGDLFGALRSANLTSVAASLVDFYPQSIRQLAEASNSPDRAELFATFDYFDACEVLRLKEGGWPEALPGSGASSRLFAQHRIKRGPPALERLPGWLIDMLPVKGAKGAVAKTPVVLWNDDTYYLNSHRSSSPPPADRLLAIAHFKFTKDFARRVRHALESKAYARGSLKYAHYDRLLRRLNSRGGSFAGPKTRKFDSAADFIDCKLMIWPQSNAGD